MMNIIEIIDKEYTEIESVKEWVNFKYDELFHDLFAKLREADKHMKSDVRPINDAELEWAITELPIDLFNAAEVLNQLRLDHEVIKLENKKRRRDLSKQLDKSAINGPAKTEELAAMMTEYEIVSSAYSTLITRVENELTYAKEFIMGCKKVWDSRRRAEQSNPITPTNTGDCELPDYTTDPLTIANELPVQTNVYIK